MEYQETPSPWSREEINDRRYKEAFEAVYNIWQIPATKKECESKARQLLVDNTLPDYYVIKTLLILTSVVDDWYEAKQCLRRAAHIYRVVHKACPWGRNQALDGYLEELFEAWCSMRDSMVEIQERLHETVDRCLERDIYDNSADEDEDGDDKNEPGDAPTPSGAAAFEAMRNLDIVIINQRFAAEFREVWDLGDKERLEECEAEARTLLKDDAIPDYYRIKTLILLGSVVDDWYEAEWCYRQAETTWRWLQGGHALGKDTDVDELLGDLRVSLNAMKNVLIEEEVDVLALEKETLDMIEVEEERRNPWRDPFGELETEDEDDDETAWIADGAQCLTSKLKLMTNAREHFQLPLIHRSFSRALYRISISPLSFLWQYDPLSSPWQGLNLPEQEQAPRADDVD